MTGLRKTIFTESEHTQAREEVRSEDEEGRESSNVKKAPSVKYYQYTAHTQHLTSPILFQRRFIRHSNKRIQKAKAEEEKKRRREG